MELSKTQSEAGEATAALTSEPLIAPEPPTAEDLDKERKQSWLKKLGAPLIPLAVLAGKAKLLFLALIKVKALTTLGTMFISIAAYGLAFGWPFAVGLVLLLFVHEMGHVIQLRREGVEASAPVFIPFLGAMIAAKSMGKDAAAEARVGLAGPILETGTLIPLAIRFSHSLGANEKVDSVSERLRSRAPSAELDQGAHKDLIASRGAREARRERNHDSGVPAAGGAPLAVEAHEVGDVLADERPSLASSDHQQFFVGEPAQWAALVDSLGVHAPLAQRLRQAGGVHLIQQ